MSATYLASTIYKNITASSGKQIAVAVVDKTTAWTRPSGQPDESVKAEFMKAVEDNLHTFKPETVTVALKEGVHTSQSDSKPHFTLYGLNKDNEVIEARHLYRPS